MLRRSAHKLVAWTPTLHAIISGTASIGGRTWSRMPPATAEKAKPARPETKPPANTAALSSKKDPMSPTSRVTWFVVKGMVRRSGRVSRRTRLCLRRIDSRLKGSEACLIVEPPQPRERAQSLEVLQKQGNSCDFITPFATTESELDHMATPKCNVAHLAFLVKAPRMPRQANEKQIFWGHA